MLAVLALSARVPAEESTHEDEPAPETVEGLSGQLTDGFKEEQPRRTLTQLVQSKLTKLPPFFRDTELELNARNYYFHRHRTDGSRAEAWAIGGSLAYRSGWLKDVFRIGAQVYTSQRIIGKRHRDGTLLLEPGQKGYTVLGQAYAQLKFLENRVTLFRQTFDLPYVNKRDNRMTPNTFEAYTIKGVFERAFTHGSAAYIAGHVTRIKNRNDDQFISMSDAAGASSAGDQGLTMLGARVQPVKGLTFGAIDYHVNDVINILYAAADYTHPVTEQLKLRFQFQFTDQRSVGSHELTGASFDTRVYGGRLALSYRNATFRVAFSTTDEEEDIRSPYGSYPGYLSLMRKDFNRAGEDAWGVGLSYHFKGLGAEGLSMFANYAQGRHARDPQTSLSRPDHEELNLTIDYRFQQKALKGLWLRVRGAVLNVEDQWRKSRELRVIFNYDW